MNLKPIVFLIFLISVFGNAQDLNKIRLEYPQAVNNFELVSQMEGTLTNIKSGDNVVLMAYKGAVSALNAKFSKQKNEKKKFFKAAIVLIEDALKMDPKNIEIRYIRLSVQQNSPKFLGYHKNIEKDKEFVLTNYENIASKDLRNLIKDFILNSESFSDREKTEFQKG